MPIVARLTASVLPARQVSGETEGRMYALFERYYSATSPAAFHADLTAKRLVILLHDERDVLRGFSTLAVDEFEHAGRRRRAVFSGDTIIHHEFWGEQASGWTGAVTSAALASQFTAPACWLSYMNDRNVTRYWVTEGFSAMDYALVTG